MSKWKKGFLPERGGLDDEMGTGCGEADCKEVGLRKGTDNTPPKREWGQFAEG